MELKETIFKRRSIRKYQDKNVSDQLIDELLKAAMAAPSARNAKPWAFYVIKNGEILSDIKQVITSANYNAKLGILVAGDMHKALPEPSRDYWIEDCSAATENLLLRATSLGLGSVWCGVYPSIPRVDAILKILLLPDNIVPFAFVNIGYPAEEKEERTQYDANCVHVVE
ncbi:MAG: nitroreductase family protein [Bacilli bacterium]|jgi:nitroreductase